MLNEFMTLIEGEIMQLNDAEFVVASIIANFISLYAFYMMAKRQHFTRLIENTPTSKIRSAAQGYIELSGKAKLMDGSTLVSPLSGRSCVWYRYKIEEEYTYRDSKGNTITGWRIINAVRSEDLFLLEDKTGRCIIDQDDAEIVTSDKRVWHDRTLLKPRRYTEELITQQEPLYAIGLFKTVDQIQRHKFKLHVSQLLRQWKKSPNLLLLQYDKDNNGKLNEQEWQQVKLAAKHQIQREYGQQEQQQALNLMAMSKNKDQAFILSTLSQQKLIQRYKAHLIGYLLTFFIAGSLVVWTINIRLGA